MFRKIALINKKGMHCFIRSLLFIGALGSLAAQAQVGGFGVEIRNPKLGQGMPDPQRQKEHHKACADWHEPRVTEAPCLPGTWGRAQWVSHWQCGLNGGAGHYGPAMGTSACYMQPVPVASVCNSASEGHTGSFKVGCDTASSGIASGMIMEGGDTGSEARWTGYYWVMGQIRSGQQFIPVSGVKLCGGVPPVAVTEATCRFVPEFGNFPAQYRWILN